MLKYESIRHHHHNSRHVGNTGRTSFKDLHKKPLVLEPETEPKALELLLNSLPYHPSWLPTNAFRKLGFINLFIRILCVQTRPDYQNVPLKLDSIKLMLNVLRVATVSPGVISDLCETVTIKDSDETGIG